MLSITKIFHFEAAHAISVHPGNCRKIHGHSYSLHISVSSEKLNNLNMIMDFFDLKILVQEKVLEDYDHALILKKSTISIGEFPEVKFIWLDEEPTAEYMILDIKNRLLNFLPEGIKLIRIRLHETRSNYAEWTAD
ncbi:MAG: 6-carboxytetrahydropterin synthase [Saprospiraceae bacterium]|nr:6-carboxytetrahydropterin synthase [Saprospiraceae bacterium]